MGKSETDVRAKLQAISGALRDVDHLGPEARQRLADLGEELSRAIATEQGSPTNAAHLSDSVARLALAIQENREPGLLESARNRLEQAVVSTEIESPMMSGIASRLIQTLADLGI